jgi:hypothetical protein
MKDQSRTTKDSETRCAATVFESDRRLTQVGRSVTDGRV